MVKKKLTIWSGFKVSPGSWLFQVADLGYGPIPLELYFSELLRSRLLVVLSQTPLAKHLESRQICIGMGQAFLRSKVLHWFSGSDGKRIKPKKTVL